MPTKKRINKPARINELERKVNNCKENIRVLKAQIKDIKESPENYAKTVSILSNELLKWEDVLQECRIRLARLIVQYYML